MLIGKQQCQLWNLFPLLWKNELFQFNLAGKKPIVSEDEDEDIHFDVEEKEKNIKKAVGGQRTS